MIEVNQIFDMLCYIYYIIPKINNYTFIPYIYYSGIIVMVYEVHDCNYNTSIPIRFFLNINSSPFKEQ